MSIIMMAAIALQQIDTTAVGLLSLVPQFGTWVLLLWLLLQSRKENAVLTARLYALADKLATRNEELSLQAREANERREIKADTLARDQQNKLDTQRLPTYQDPKVEKP